MSICIKACRRTLTSLALAALAAAPPVTAAQPLQLHLPSPDWRDQVIYFVMTDRFDDGDPTNNDQGAGEFDPRSNAHFNGGDFAGLQRRIDYLRGLGVTAVWITPPVANQWWDAGAQYSGYHGYWAENFVEVDRHLGTLDDYRALSGALHRQGLYLVQDIVVNHTGNFFAYGAGWTAGDPARGYRRNAGSRPLAAPSQAPFDLNDPREPMQRKAAIYHWTPDVRDFADARQVLTWQMSGLDDLNTENPRVQRALRASYGHWIREVGVDAFRVDTAFYVPPAFFEGFLHSTDRTAPGIDRIAADTGRRAFFTFGEGFAIDKPFATRESRAIERYVRGPGGVRRMSGMLNFPLYGSLGDVLARGAPTAVLGHRIGRMMRVHIAPHLMPTFVDNHDVDRFLAGGSEAALRQALLAIMTLPGVPVVYYGTEQGFTMQRGAMFAAGYGAGGRDHFDTDHPLYRAIAAMTALRRTHRLFSRGTPTVLQSSDNGPGVLAWRMQHGSDAALVVLNTADSPVLMHHLPTGLPAGVDLPGLLALDGEPAALRTGAGGRLTAVLPARSGQVWQLPRASRPSATARTPEPRRADLAVSTARPAGPGDRLLARGRGAAGGARARGGGGAPGGGPPARPPGPGHRLGPRGRPPAGSALQLVVDGDLSRATPAQADDQGRWQADIDIGHLAESQRPHQLAAWLPERQRASAAKPFAVRRQWTLLADVADPAGDDHGPDGRYRYPADPSWGDHHQMDLRHARVWRSGDALKIELTMAGLTQTWRPQNGFDHVAFTLFFSLPGRRDGVAEMPLQNARLPDGMTWQYRLRAHGWSNALFAAEGASASAEGRALTPGAALEVDAARRRLRITLPAGALGAGSDLSGLQLLVTTWDYDGGYRALAPLPGSHTLGGGEPAGAKVMDQMLIRLP